MTNVRLKVYTVVDKTPGDPRNTFGSYASWGPSLGIVRNMWSKTSRDAEWQGLALLVVASRDQENFQGCKGRNQACACGISSQNGRHVSFQDLRKLSQIYSLTYTYIYLDLICYHVPHP